MTTGRGTFASTVFFAPDTGAATARPPRDQVADKLMWTLVRPSDTSSSEFGEYLVHELGPAAAALVADSTGAFVTLQAPHAFSGAIIEGGAGDRRVDAVLQVLSSRPYGPTDPVNAVLAANCGHVQGWRMHEAIIFDETAPVAPGTKLSLTHMLWINQRIDGTTPEFYDRNWYIHAGHTDGKPEESDASRRRHEERHEQGEVTTDRWYIQNRVREPITPTAWVINGMSDFLSPYVMPSGPGERYDPSQVMGEESFDKWPPRLFQGDVYRVS